MTRERDKRFQWRMACDQSGCATRSEAFPTQPDLELFQGRGWFIAQSWGDICPACLKRGVKPTAKRYRPCRIAKTAGGQIE